MRRYRNTRPTLPSWWMLALRGSLAILFGLAMLFLPGIALLAFIAVFATYCILDGLLSVTVALREWKRWHRWGWMLFGGVITLLAGVLAIFYPEKTALILLYIIASWVVLLGIGEITAAFILREYLIQEWALILVGVLSLAFGLFLFIHPGAGLLSVLWLVGLYSISSGVLIIVRAFQLRSWTSLVITQTR